jgi:hypothetical protein
MDPPIPPWVLTASFGYNVQIILKITKSRGEDQHPNILRARRIFSRAKSIKL